MTTGANGPKNKTIIDKASTTNSFLVKGKSFANVLTAFFII
mgnify:CR=1 FL=1